MAKLKNSNCDKTQKNKLWHNLKNQIVTKIKNSNCAKLKKFNCVNSKTQIVIVIKMTVVTKVVIMTSFSKNTLTPWQPTNSQGSFSQFSWCLVFFFKVVYEKEEKNGKFVFWQNQFCEEKNLAIFFWSNKFLLLKKFFLVTTVTTVATVTIVTTLTTVTTVTTVP